MLWTTAHQKKVIHTLEQSASCRVSWETGDVSIQGFSEQGWGVFEPLGKTGPGQLHLMSHFWVGPFKDKKRLAVGPDGGRIMGPLGLAGEPVKWFTRVCMGLGALDGERK
jgi:hypothetical protein